MSIGEKIFVYKQASQENPPDGSDMLALLIALHQHGPNTLLFVTQETAAHPQGSVEQIYPGLLHGYTKAGASQNTPLSQKSWLDICTNALSLRARA
jgi:hypothetical protein